MVKAQKVGMHPVAVIGVAVVMVLYMLLTSWLGFKKIRPHFITVLIGAGTVFSVGLKNVIEVKNPVLLLGACVLSTQ